MLRWARYCRPIRRKITGPAVIDRSETDVLGPFQLLWNQRAIDRITSAEHCRTRVLLNGFICSIGLRNTRSRALGVPFRCGYRTRQRSVCLGVLLLIAGSLFLVFESQIRGSVQRVELANLLLPLLFACQGPQIFVSPISCPSDRRARLQAPGLQGSVPRASRPAQDPARAMRCPRGKRTKGQTVPPDACSLKSDLMTGTMSSSVVPSL